MTRYSVSGQVLDSSGAPAPEGTSIVLYRRELRRRRVLASDAIDEFGEFTLAYEVPADRPPHLELRAFDQGRGLKAVSETYFCPPENLADVTLQLLPAARRTEAKSEFELLRAALARAVGTSRVRKLSDEERQFAARALCRVQRFDAEDELALISRLAAAEQWELDTGIGLAAAYGLLSYCTDPSGFDLFALIADDIARLLRQAIADNIVPADVKSAETIAALLSSRRPAEDRRPAQRVRLQILDDRNGRPIANSALSLSDERAAIALTGLRTDRAGRVAFMLAFDQGASRSLNLALFDLTGQQIADASVSLAPDQSEIEVRVALSPEIRPGDIGLSDISDDPAVTLLADRGIRTVAEILRADGGVEGVDPDDFTRVHRTARWHAAGIEPGIARALEETGFDGPLGIARIDRARFLEIVGDGLGGSERAAAFHAGARIYEAHVARLVGDAWLTFGEENDEGDDEDVDGAPEAADFEDIFNDIAECGCSDCNSALSPGAYLAHLLDWMTVNVVSAGVPITLDQLEEGFHQPFSDLTTECDGVNEKFRHIRLAIEVLWSFTGGASNPGETVFNGRYADYRRTVYAALLSAYSVTLSDLLVAQALDPSLDGLRNQLAQRLKVAVGDLPEIVLADAPDEASLQELFGLRRTDIPHTADVPMALVLRLQLAEIGRRWLAEDGDNDPWGPDQVRPAIDPRIIDDTVIRLPRDATNPVFVLYTERRDALDAERTAITTSAGAAGLLGEITNRLGRSLAELQALRDTLTGAVPASPEALADAQAETQDQLLLDVSAIVRAVEIAEMLDAEGDPALSDPEILEDAANILVGRHARSLWPDWIAAEIDENIGLSSALFHQPDLPDMPRPSLLVANDLVSGWRAALQRRSGDPVIDPAHLTPAEIVQFLEPGYEPFAHEINRDTALGLLSSRQAWADGRRSAFAIARSGAGGVAAQFEAVLAESAVPDLQDRIDALVEREAAGHDIERSIQQLAFDPPAFRAIVAFGHRAAAGLQLLADQWALIGAILIDVEKRLRATEWRAEERDGGIALHPRLFKQVDQGRVPFDVTGRAAFARRWSRRWRVRDDAVNVAFATLERVVSDAEELSLHILRDALIRRGPLTGQTLAERASDLDTRLLVAMDAGGCQCTTRVAFAIETLQRLLRGVLDGTLTDALDNVAIDAENIVAARSLLSYQEWRAALFAFLWPENLTSRVLPGGASHGLERLVANMPNQLTPPKACELATAYAAYFDDISGLEVSATCLAPTFLPPDDACDPGGATVVDRLFLFGHADSGLVYWAMLDPADDAGDTRTTWRPLGRLGNVTRLLGATLHGGQGEASIVLLAEDSNAGAATLLLCRFELETGKWRGPRNLSVPQEAREKGFDASVLRKYVPDGSGFDLALASTPTLVAVHTEGGGLYIRRMKQDLRGWTDEWRPIQGPSASGRLLDFVQIRDDEAALIIGGDGGNDFRTVSLVEPFQNDDFDRISIGSGFAEFAGAIGWPDRNELISFVNPPGASRYTVADIAATRVGIPDDDLRFEELFIENIEERFRSELGVSLDDPQLFSFSGFQPYLVVIPLANVPQGSTSSLNPLNFPNTDEKFGDQLPHPELAPFNGTLYELLTMTSFQFNAIHEDWVDNEAAYIADENERNFYLIQYKNFAIDVFIEALDELTQTNPFASPAYWWTFLDDQVRRLTENRHGIRSLIRQTFLNSISEPMIEFGWDPNFDDEEDGSVKPIQFVQRTSSVSVSASFSGGIREQRIAGTSGYDHLPGLENRKPVALWKEFLPNDTGSGAFWTVVRRSGGGISAIGDQRITLNTSAEPQILPPEDPGELLDRRDGSENLYTKNEDGPPSIQALLRERSVLVPIMLGDALCAAGHHAEAQEWYRTVYDEGADAGSRKISYGLIEEEDRPLSFNAIDTWLRDPDDVHAVALTRRESDTRRVLLSIIACLVAEADANFARDLPETISKARDLYRRALELLARLRGLTGVDRCADIIGRLRFELEDQPDLPIDDFTLVLGELPSPGIVRETVDDLIAIARDPSVPQGETVARMRERLGEVRPHRPRRRPVSARIETRARIMTRAESRLLATNHDRALLSQMFRVGERRRADLIARIDSARAELDVAGTWLTTRDLDPPILDPRDRRTPERSTIDTRLLRAYHLRAASPLAAISLAGLSLTDRVTGTVLSFCIPQNPELEALRRRAETALDRIRTCRNVAGYERVYDPYGGPIGIGRNGLAPGAPAQVDVPPVPVRYGTLLPQARMLANVAAQIEARYLAALEGEDRERLNLLQVEQSLQVAEARVTRSALAVGASEANVELARRQREHAIIGAEHYNALIEAGNNKHEDNVIKSYLKTGESNPLKQLFKFLGSLGSLGASFTGFTNPFSSITDLVSLTRELSELELPENPIDAIDQIEDPGPGGVASGVDTAAKGLDKLITFLLKEEGGGKKINIAALEGFRGDLKRRSEDWKIKRDLARQDIEIGTQEILTEQFALELARADQAIAELELSHAADILTFLQMKNLSAEAYRWMASILGEAYRDVLQRATAIGQLAEQALAFERFALPAGIVAGDYWQVDLNSQPNGDIDADLRGLTGSARLLRDLSRLEFYATSSLTQRVPIKMELDLALLDSESFQRFRETGVLEFDTTRQAFQQQLPGFYAASISTVSIGLQALSLSGEGLSMTLESRGMSRVVVRPETAASTLVRGLPETRFLTGMPEGDRLLSMIPRSEGVRGAFEGTGFEQSWRLVADRGANALFDFDAIAGMTFRIEGTALHSPLYADQVSNALGRDRTGDLILSLRGDYPSAWQTLGAAADEGDPLSIAVALARGLYPVNLGQLSLDHLLIAVISTDDEETVFDAILFTPSSGAVTVGGAVETVEGRISTRNSTGAALSDLLDGPVTGSLRLTFAEETRDRLLAGHIRDVLIVPSYSGGIT